MLCRVKGSLHWPRQHSISIFVELRPACHSLCSSCYWQEIVKRRMNTAEKWPAESVTLITSFIKMCQLVQNLLLGIHARDHGDTTKSVNTRFRQKASVRTAVLSFHGFSLYLAFTNVSACTNNLNEENVKT
jgi:hypothetical protein